MMALRFIMLTRRVFSGAAAAAPALAQVLPDRPDEPAAGRFVRRWWYEKGIEHGNPVTNSRFRVNSPEVALHQSFGSRSETRSSGMLQILMEENLRDLDGVELALELWGGHPGTMNKRVTPNGRTTYYIPEVGAAAGHCTHQHPTIRLKVTDVVNGHNAIQFACDQGPSFWGHFIVEEACLRASLKPDHADLKKAGLAGFEARVKAEPGAARETIRLSLDADAKSLARVSRVLYQGFYNGYDENGNKEAADWHGFLKNRNPVAYLGEGSGPEFRAEWDLAMLPEQTGMAVRACVYLKDQPALEYNTAAVRGLAVPSRPGSRVALFSLKERPVPFWSRAKRLKTATLDLPVDPKQIEKAALHVLAWDGGRGDIKDPFKLNGAPVEVAGTGKHDTMYTVTAIEPARLRQGVNTIELISGTEHHGIEVLEPGPALMVRYRV